MASHNGTFMYLLREREHIRCNDSVCKLGFTTDFKSRMQAYPNGSLVLLSVRVDDGRKVERLVLRAFAQFFTPRRDIGAEYFEGSAASMVALLASTAAPFVCAVPAVAVDADDVTEVSDAVVDAESSLLPNESDATGDDYDPPEAEEDGASDVAGGGAEGSEEAEEAVPAFQSRDVHFLVSAFVDEHRARLSGAVVKAMDLFQEVGSWVTSRAPGVVLSFKALRASLRQAFDARSTSHLFGSGETCEAFIFPALVQAPPTLAAPNKLHEFLAMDDAARGCSIRHIKGRVTWALDLEATFFKCKHFADAKFVLDVAVLAAFGFRTSGDKYEHVCKTCKQLAKGGKMRCCPAYDKDANRTKKVVVYDMVIEAA